MYPGSARIAKVAKDSGRKLPWMDSGVRDSAALISIADWSLEFPFPVPPKVHVSFLTCPHVHSLHKGYSGVM